MCIDDGRVVSNFVAQVNFAESVKMGCECLCLYDYYNGDDANDNAGIEEGATDSLWWWKADQEFPVCFWSGMGLFLSPIFIK